MRISFQLQLINFFFYLLFFFFYWIERSQLNAAIIASIFLIFSYFIKPLKKGLELTIVVTFTHLLLWSFKFIPYLSWPFDFYIISGFGFLLMRFLFNDRIKLNWSFRFSKPQLLSIALINVPSIAILLWYFFQNKEVAQQWPLPDIPNWAIPLVVVLIAAVNGLREEIYYRGLLQTVSSEKYSPWFVVFFQAVSFGFLHYMGAFPQGWVGVGLTAAWGALLAVQYIYYRSIALSWLTHSIADAIMFTVILVTR